jgi:hypothetical protein
MGECARLAFNETVVTDMSEGQKHTVRFVDRERRIIEVSQDKVLVTYPMNAVPDPLYEAMLSTMDGRDEPYDKVRRLWSSSLMKAAVCTTNTYGPFPQNVSIKIVRLTLTDEQIDQRIEDLEGEVLAMQGRAFEDTVQERIDIYRSLYADESRIDRFRLGAVEMFKDATFNNIQRDPRVGLALCWPRPGGADSYGYQLSCIAQMVFPPDPFYRFMRLMRTLFSPRFTELQGRSEYPCSYKLWISEVQDKSLAQPRAGFVP